MVAETGGKVRLDKWLWAARFFKTRALATEAINGGHVHLNGSRPKPSRPLQVGDELVIRKGQEEFRLTVRELSARRGPASVAQLLYEEHEESRQKREALREQRRLEAAAAPQPSRRPDKKGRRKIIRFINKYN
ncbi:MAG: S4 domain-containing protein [Gammaproteobacteria bacterium]|nr:S4 domain-containing protein [Gammaproteobacteria bacterium]MCW8839641.1 S4 domain-containing protein [Gammaproteobacteria bacterium]MCW8928048.1 S4 domain-containing protein [Gammaproteobacteria bacterium]MCW8958017.1 S4 domain-containing protein [Gammaproteobacteria bacterium]MCW8973476.1 S4 domain-containing protein [Gammaproteobacteria bacterium]